MSRVTRRSVIVAGASGIGLAAMPFPVWFEKYAAAQTTLTRYSAASTQGAAMIAQYATAVQAMMGAKSSDPTSWIWQWYTHWTPTPPGKAGAINTIFGGAGNAVAQAMWNTCQPHGSGMNPDNFLPWHRMYVYYFERIVRKITGNPAWTLPYWDYTNPTLQALPQPFISPGNTSNPLYRPNRNATSNNGQAITTDYGGPNTLNLDSMRQSNYSGNTGFCNQLNNGLHGNVHGMTGNGQGMGSVPTAAGDPIFWLHHCNIDRVWASWNNAGGSNPTSATWQAQTFTFVDENGVQVTAMVKDFLSIVPLNYTYDVFLTPPGAQVAAAGSSARFSAAAVKTVGTSESGVRLGGAPARVALADRAPTADKSKSLMSAIQRETYLQLDGVKAATQPEVLYNVYLDLPPGATPSTDSPHYVGTLNFFSAVPHADGHTGHGPADPGATVVFNVTEQIAALRQRNLASDNPVVTLVPSGDPAKGSDPRIDRVQLVTG